MPPKKKTYTENYIRPEHTYTDNLTAEQIAEKLQDYIKVNDVNILKKEDHIRYFNVIADKNNGIVKKEFRMGGFFLTKDAGPNPAYIVLTNGKVSWSVQLEDSVIYKKMSLDELKIQYEHVIDELKKANNKLYQQNKKFKDEFKRRNIDYKKL